MVWRKETATNFVDADTVDWAEVAQSTRLIVVASEGLDVSKECGYAQNYNYFRVVDGEIANSQNLPARGPVDSKYARTFKPLGVDVLVVSEMPETQMRDFLDEGITVAFGAQGRAYDAAEAYLDGDLNVVFAK